MNAFMNSNEEYQNGFGIAWANNAQYTPTKFIPRFPDTKICDGDSQAIYINNLY